MMRPTFFMRDICNFHTTGMGRTSVTRRVKTLSVDVAMYDTVELMQEPSMSLSQKYSGGVHWKGMRNACIMIQAMLTAMMSHEMNLTSF